MVIFEFINGTKRRGRKSSAQTPSPKRDRVFGSKINKKGSAKDGRGNIKFSSITQSKINSIIKGTKIPTSVANAVVRRGFGAYSTSHRPNVSRVAWGLARLKQFVRKYKGLSTKKSYTQDDDLLKEI